jgi:hypothetical protein
MTILSASSGSGRCNAIASSHGARIHTSAGSPVARLLARRPGNAVSAAVLANIPERQYKREDLIPEVTRQVITTMNGAFEYIKKNKADACEKYLAVLREAAFIK